MNVAALLEEHLAPESRNRRLLQYVLVGALGLGVNQGVLFLATGIVGLPYFVGGTLSRVLSVLTNYALNDAWTWSGRGEAGAYEYAVRGLKYVLTRIVGIAIGLAALVVFVEVLGLHYLIANVLAIGVGIVWGFGASERWVWRSEDTELSRVERTLVDAGTRVDERLAAYDVDSQSVRRRLEPSAERAERRLRDVGSRGAKHTMKSTGSDGTTASDGGQLGWSVPPLTRTELRERLPTADRATLAVFALAGALFVGFTVYTSLLFRGYRLTGADFGSYLHMFWTTVNGYGFLQQGKFVAGHPGGVYWGAHFSLTLLGFLPFFAVWQSAYALLAMKSFVIAASIPLLWFVARHHIERRRLAGLVVVSYAFNPFLWSAWAFDFQEQSLLPLLVLAGYLLYVRGRRRAFLVVLTLALFTNEFVVPLAFGFLLGLGAGAIRDGGLSAPDRRTLLAGFGLTVVAHVVAGFVIGQFSTVVGVPVSVIAGPFQPLFEGARVSLSQLVPVAILNPDVAFLALTSGLRQKVIYLVAFSLPVLFVAYTDEVTLGSLAPFVGFAWLVSNRAAYVTFSAHYPLYLLPFVYIGTVRAVGRWGHLLPSVSDLGRPRLPWQLVAKLVVAILLLNAGAFIVIEGGNMKPIEPKATEDHRELIRTGLAAIPDEASVITQNDLYPHVARRPNAGFVANRPMFERYEREVGPITPEYIVYDTTLHEGWAEQIVDSFDGRLANEYQLYRYQDGFWVFKRGYEGSPTAVTTDREITYVTDSRTFDAGALSTATGVRQSGAIVSQDGEAGQRIWYGPYAVLAPGTYTATFTMHANGTGDRPAATVDVAVGESHRVITSGQVDPKPGSQEVTLQFTLDRPRAKVEFRGAHAASGGTVAIEGVSLTRRTSSSDAGQANAALEATVATPADTTANAAPIAASNGGDARVQHTRLIPAVLGTTDTHS
jgi:uncharacterized membrane protein/putative flippase GtrA